MADSQDFTLVSTGAFSAHENLNYQLAREVMKTNWINLWGDITDIVCENISLFILDSLNKGVPKITIFICSAGGSEDDARALIAVMEYAKSMGMIIRVFGAGLIASAAFDIFIAGSKGHRFVHELSMFMTHSSAIETRDKSMVRLQEELDEYTLQKYTKIHKATRERYLETGNWYFSPAEGLKYGCCEAIIKPGDKLPDTEVVPPKPTRHDPQKEVQDVGEDPT